MPLEFVVKHFEDAPSSSAIQRFFIDMPITPKKLCMIRQVQVEIVQRNRILNFDAFYAMSIDPDHVLTSMVLLDSTMFLSGVWEIVQGTLIGFHAEGGTPFIFHFPEGIQCPHGRLPFFVQHSNTNANDIDWIVKVFFEFEPISAKELSIAVLRRGRGVTRRVP